MTISIALCTFNGGPYLARQLDSIARQTRLPAELIVCDDRSSDNTQTIIQAFTSSAPFPVRLYVNERQLGVRKNFERAISLCESELIALSDQDDLWHCEKLQMIEALFSSSSNIGLVFSDAELIDEHSRAEERSLWQSVGFDSRKQELVMRGKALEVLLGINVVTGATMAFRSKFRDIILPIPAEGCLYHDGWVALIIAAIADIAFIDRRLIKYRQHPAQLVGAPRRATAHDTISIRKTDPQHYLEQATRFQEAYERLVNCDVSPKREVFSNIHDKIIHLRARATMPDKRLSRVRLVLQEILNSHYHQYSRGWFSAAKDLLV